jgi:hypothetical protein
MCRNGGCNVSKYVAKENIQMIHHVSIPAREPQHVAEVLAELMNGKCFPFGPLEGAFMAASGDANGTMIEVYPERATLDIPDHDDQVVFAENPAPPRSWPFHIAVSAPTRRNRSNKSARVKAGALRFSAAACGARSRSFTSSSSGWKTGY